MISTCSTDSKSFSQDEHIHIYTYIHIWYKWIYIYILYIYIWYICVCVIYIIWNKIYDIWISPKSIPNSEKQKQLPNTQWMKYVYCPALFYSRGRACKLQSRHKHCMKKTFFQKRLRYCGQHARSSCKGFSSQRTAVRLTLHFIYLTYIIHIFFVLCITYIFYTIF